MRYSKSMSPFPSVHEELDISPLTPTQVLTRLKELAEKKFFSGLFFGNMFTMQYIKKNLKSTRERKSWTVVTGYFTSDSKKIIFDYTMSKPYKTVTLLCLALVPLILLIIYLTITAGNLPVSKGIYLLTAVFFYIVCGALTMAAVTGVFKLQKKRMHRLLSIQVLY